MGAAAAPLREEAVGLGQGRVLAEPKQVRAAALALEVLPPVVGPEEVFPRGLVERKRAAGPAEVSLPHPERGQKRTWC